MVLGKLDRYIQKNETKPPTYMIHKNKLEIDKRLKCKLWEKKEKRLLVWKLPLMDILPIFSIHRELINGKKIFVKNE